MKPGAQSHSAVPLRFTLHEPLLRQSTELHGSVKHKRKKLPGEKFEENKYNKILTILNNLDSTSTWNNRG